MILRSRSLVAATVLCLALLWAGPSPVAAEPGVGPPNASSTAGPIEVSTTASVVAGPVGPLVETEVLVSNTAAQPAKVVLIGEFIWPDGSHKPFVYGPPMDVPANGAVLISALNLVPPSAGSGTGLFSATALVGTMGKGGHGGDRGRLIATDHATFVLP